MVFGGYNSKAGTLISNDLYVLSLNGEHNAMLPNTTDKKQQAAMAKKKTVEKQVLSKKNILGEEVKEVHKTLSAPAAPSETSASIPVAEKPPTPVKATFIEQS